MYLIYASAFGTKKACCDTFWHVPGWLWHPNSLRCSVKHSRAESMKEIPDGAIQHTTTVPEFVCKTRICVTIMTIQKSRTRCYSNPEKKRWSIVKCTFWYRCQYMQSGNQEGDFRISPRKHNTATESSATSFFRASWPTPFQSPKTIMGELTNTFSCPLNHHDTSPRCWETWFLDSRRLLASSSLVGVASHTDSIGPSDWISGIALLGDVPLLEGEDKWYNHRNKGSCNLLMINTPHFNHFVYQQPWQGCS